jgi:multidrug transporter EmrE-like cation transporter
MVMSIASLSHAIQSSGFFTSVRQSELFYPSVLATHLTCIAIFGGMILTTDLRLLNLALKNTPASVVIESMRVWKRIGFVIMIACGILLAGSHLDKYYPNPYFQLKLSLLVLAGIHGLIFHRSVYYNASLDQNGKLPMKAVVAGTTSLVLWLSIMTCGRWIAYYDDPNAIARLVRGILRLV